MEGRRLQCNPRYKHEAGKQQKRYGGSRHLMPFLILSGTGRDPICRPPGRPIVIIESSHCPIVELSLRYINSSADPVTQESRRSPALCYFETYTLFGISGIRDYAWTCNSGTRSVTLMVMSHLPLLAGVLFALSIILPMIMRLFRPGPRDKARVVIDYVHRRGYALVNPSLEGALNVSYRQMFKDPALRNPSRASADIADIEGLSNGTGDWLAFICTLRSKEVTIFNLDVTTQAKPAIPYKVAKIRTVGLPKFSLGRNSALHTILRIVDRIAGASKPTIDLNARLYPEFSAHSWITGPDPAAVTAFLSADRIRYLETEKLPGILATNANYLVYFENGILLEDEDFDAFIARVEKLVANIL